MYIIHSFNLIYNVLHNDGTNIEIIQKLQNRALRKINFKKFHHSKEHKILKFTDILKVQNCLFMYQVEQNNALATSFPTLHSWDKHNYQTRATTHNLLDVPLTRPNKYDKESFKDHCIRDWSNLKKTFPQMPENKLSHVKFKWLQVIFDQYWTFIHRNNFYIRTRYYFHFL